MKWKAGVLTIALAGVALFGANAGASELLSSLEAGDVNLESIGPINFGPEGILFIADPRAAMVFAIDTQDREMAGGTRSDLPGIDGKIAALLGVSREEVLVNDMALNPLSGNTYLSVSRGRGPESTPVLMRFSPDAKLSVIDLKGVAHAKASLWPAPEADSRGRDRRQDAITELAYVKDSVFVAGLSNQEFSSRLRVFPFPFTDKEWDTGLEIYHTAHGRWETNSPIRTFAPIFVDEEPFILAAHTCTPLVKVPVSSLLADNEKVTGDTIAELGNRNRPLDMLVYNKDNKDWLLITNSTRGVMKLAMEPVPGLDALTEKVEDKGGLEAELLASLDGTLQIEACGDGMAVALRQNGDGLDITTVALP